MGNRVTKDGRRLYEQVAEELAKSIADGRYKVGQRLPSERDLTRTFAVSRPTIREAIIALEIDGLVEVRVGSGVYVIHDTPPTGESSDTDVGPFEVLEARRVIESEVCGLAAARIDDAQLEELEQLLATMQETAESDLAQSEEADRRFHLLIAEATENAPLVSAVDELWEARARSPQYRKLAMKAQVAGIAPRTDEHRAIFAALRNHDAAAARAAMRDHLSRVIDSLLAATEIEELERARAQVEVQRQRYSR